MAEDSCGAHGAEVDGQKTGSVVIAEHFPLFQSSHYDRRGGAITTSDSDLADACRSIRAHGWFRR